jgi:hypothetical protein
MRKLLTLALMLASLGFMGSWTETKASTVANASPQIRIQIGRRRHERDWRYRDYRYYGERGFSTSIQTRLVRYGWNTYRETYEVRYFPNGRTETTLISRVRID